ncbi:aromatic-ring-hydroxylating dioxygenase subunit beta [Paraburkholderia dipogonis]|uniref:aromatic-ring-hydroxylating dioxygenase subunit beta n=1 Tax=Paraburkholderia dipogonis TaxID=1211383 RepID=UPI00244C393F|nr:aromatic-ring-hydroxylating dioxygenase subunit beta [Paraburkholderia dipogonis]
MEATAKWATHGYRFGTSSYFFGDSTHRLKPSGSSWIIMKKHIVLLNDKIDSVLDFYHV